jgi:hypothetical protein
MTYSQPVDNYISARGRALAINILMILQLVLLGLTILLSVAGMEQLGSGEATLLTAAGGLETLQGLLFLATLIVYMTWVYRSIANLPALGSMSCRFTPGGAVWSFFIPFVNLVRGHQVMATIWQESQPPAVNENGFYLPRSTAIVGWWWGMLLVMRIGGGFIDKWTPTGLDDARSLLQWDISINLVRMAAGVLFLIMVRRAQQRQDAQWQDLELRRSVPQPTADVLR